jgi:uncharacterized damage-inducible protein DinB
MTTASSESPSAHRAFIDRYLAAFEPEFATTMRVLAAYPDDKLDMRPHPKCKTARELAWLFVREMGMLATATTTGFDWSKAPPPAPQPPETMVEILAALDAGHDRFVTILRETTDDDFPKHVAFFVAPKTPGDIPMHAFLWFILHDQIHHRGQFSIYLRMADAKVPSIYGPTADEPWV